MEATAGFIYVYMSAIWEIRRRLGRHLAMYRRRYRNKHPILRIRAASVRCVSATRCLFCSDLAILQGLCVYRCVIRSPYAMLGPLGGRARWNIRATTPWVVSQDNADSLRPDGQRRLSAQVLTARGAGDPIPCAPLRRCCRRGFPGPRH